MGPTSRLALLASFVFAVSAAGCSTPCQDLGDRLCACAGAGTTRTSCENTIKNKLSDLNPGKDVQDLCSAKLSTCNAPKDVVFCDWLFYSACGKASCGLSVEDPKTVCEAPAAPAGLQSTPVDGDPAAASGDAAQ